MELAARPLRDTDVWTPETLPDALAPLARRQILYASRVSAGPPLPTEDDAERVATLDEVIGATPETTFFLGVEGDSMVDACIHDGDLLVVDRTRQPADGDIVVAALNGELTVKRLRHRNGLAFLLPENPDYAPIEVDEYSDLTVWGVVTHVLHDVRRS
ncbi:LexA family protein [Rubrivirga sp. IMCC43871]|uniref:LexA family protein n=1 Tax=Rubrivirga sp. IMCC43871 TaxID=3391575 RepID=UPI00398FEC80